MPYGPFNDPSIQAHAARIDDHQRGHQAAFPKQGGLTSHLMTLEVVEQEAALPAFLDPTARYPRCQLPVVQCEFWTTVVPALLAEQSCSSAPED